MSGKTRADCLCFPLYFFVHILSCGHSVDIPWTFLRMFRGQSQHISKTHTVCKGKMNLNNQNVKSEINEALKIL